MSSISSMFNNTFVGRFLNWKQGDEDDIWRNKALEVLLKKVNRANQTDHLKLALKLKKEGTPCVTLDRSKDGRLQVMHRKMLPHVMYCRIFRWPDLQSQHELRSLPSCRWPAHLRELSEICVNPYHYSRVDHSNYPPVVSPRNNEFTNASPPPYSPMSSASNYSSQQQSPPYLSRPSFQTSPHQLDNPNDPYNYFGSQPQVQSSIQPLGLTNYHANQPSTVSEAVGWYDGHNALMGGTQSEENMQPTTFGARVHSSPLPAYSAIDQGNMPIPMEINDEGQRGSAVDKDSWCQIHYFELNQKVGESFTSSAPAITVDGFTDPENRDRYSLGRLTTPNRSKAIQQNCNVENQLNQHAVVKIESGKRHKMFDQKIFEDLLQEALRSHDGKNFERLSSLVEHCTIKLSFIKGWGSIYKRQDVTSTPCWIDIQLLKYYTLIDQHLRNVEPSTQITSTS